MPLDHPGAWFLQPPFGGREPPRKSRWTRFKEWLRRKFGLRAGQAKEE